MFYKINECFQSTFILMYIRPELAIKHSRYQFNSRQLAYVDGRFMLIAAYKSGHIIRLHPPDAVV